jgi:NAD(P)-dependent dehydrogenase (short-subunit alcohol dehydrogenase family)
VAHPQCPAASIDTHTYAHGLARCPPPQESIEKAVADITAALERDGLPLGALINNAGIAQKYPVEFHPMSAMRRIFEVRGRPPCL